MGREACCGREGLNRWAWTAEEDRILKDYVQTHGEGRWRTLPRKQRCGKSCRLRWLNYLRPDIKIGNISEQEEDLIIRLHRLLGNRWSLIAGRLPGRTDNEIKNYWNTNLRKRVQGRSSSHSLQPKCNEHEEKLKAGAAPAATAAPPIHAEESLTIAEEVNNPPVEVPKPISSTAIERQETSTHEGCSSVDPQMESIWDFLLKGDARHESTCTDIIDDNSSLHCCHGELQLWDGMMRALESEGRTVMPSVAEQYSCGGNLHDWAALFEPVREDSALEVELFASSFGS